MFRRIASLIRRAVGAAADPGAAYSHARVHPVHPDWIGALPACPDCIPYDQLYAACGSSARHRDLAAEIEGAEGREARRSRPR